MTSKPFLSIIIPAYNEAQRLPKTLRKMVAFVHSQDYTTEVIVVENGSIDNTAAVVTEFAEQYPFIKLIRATERGKGLAIKTGMLRATGDYRFICDADLSMPLSELPKFIMNGTDQADVMIGTREGQEAQRIGEPIRRHIFGRIANIIIQAVVISGYPDTQCGFKMFKEHVALDLFSKQKLNGIGFDVELLFLAQKHQYSIREVPIVWYYDSDTRMSLMRDSLKMFGELFQIRRNWYRGVYSRHVDIVDVERSPSNQYV